jgi:hypothetical protein
MDRVDMIKIVHIIPLVLALVGLVGTQPAVYGQKAIITAPPGSTLNSVTVTVLRAEPLNGTWSFVGNHSVGIITFGTDPVSYEPNAPAEPEFGFAGFFGGVPVSWAYNYEGGMLSLWYTYHNRDVEVWGGLDFIDSHHMELRDITDVFTHHWNYALTASNPDTCCRAVTGLHIHPNDTIQFALEYTHVAS